MQYSGDKTPWNPAKRRCMQIVDWTDHATRQSRLRALSWFDWLHTRSETITMMSRVELVLHWLVLPNARLGARNKEVRSVARAQVMVQWITLGPCEWWRMAEVVVVASLSLEAMRCRQLTMCRRRCVEATYADISWNVVCHAIPHTQWRIIEVDVIVEAHEDNNSEWHKPILVRKNLKKR
jgi:hypothetical protein